MSKRTKKKDTQLKVSQGLLITCDTVLKQFLLNLEDTSGIKFIQRDLDETHLFIKESEYPSEFENVTQWLNHEINKWSKQYSYDDDDD